MASSIVDFRVRLPQPLRPAGSPLPTEYRAQYDAVLGLDKRRELGLDALLGEMDEAGVSRALVHAEYEYVAPADELNEALAGLVAEYADRFCGVGTVSLEPLRVRRAVAQAERVAELGFVGLNLQPSFFGIPADDRKMYPLYSRAAELGLFVCLHTGINYTSHQPLGLGHPLLLDQIACDFPELSLVACHAGWPWTAEIAAVARKHPRVYLEFGGLAPRYVCETGTGWDVVFRLMNSLLSERVLFGTDWPVFSHARALAEWRSGGLKENVLNALLGDNARRLLSSGTG